MKIAIGRNSVMWAIVAGTVLLAGANAQERSKGDASWTSTLVTRSIQVEWLSEQRARATLTGQRDEQLKIEATSITVSTLPDGLKVSASGQATLSFSQRQLPPVESVDLTVSRNGGIATIVRR